MFLAFSKILASLDTETVNRSMRVILGRADRVARGIALLHLQTIISLWVARSLAEKFSLRQHIEHDLRPALDKRCGGYARQFARFYFV